MAPDVAAAAERILAAGGDADPADRRTMLVEAGRRASADASCRQHAIDWRARAQTAERVARVALDGWHRNDYFDSSTERIAALRAQLPEEP